jgi:gas vesicle protein
MEKTTNNAAQLIGALVLGAAIGGALGILFAPAKGSDTRKKISAQSDDLTTSMMDKFNDFLEELKAEANATTDKANAMMQEAKTKVGI